MSKEAKNKKSKLQNNKKISKMNELANKKAPKTVQDTIPYVRVYDDTNTNGGIIEAEEGFFTKSYYIADTNYSDAGEVRQEEILKVIEHNIFNTFDVDCTYEITINNRTIDQEEFNKKMLIDYQNDQFDMLRTQHNQLVLQKMQEGKNNLKAEKYFTIGVRTEDISLAVEKFSVMERTLSLNFKKINQVGIIPLSLNERLEVLHDIYNNGHEGEFNKAFDLNSIVSQGITTKDIIGPSSFDFKKNDYFKMDDKYVRVMFLKAIPSILASDLLECVSNVGTNVIVSSIYEIQPQDKATSFASAQLTNVGGEVVKAQKNLSKAGASLDLISQRLSTAHSDSKELLAQLTNGNQSLFHVTLLVAIYADNLDDLETYTNRVKTNARSKLCYFEILRSQQEQGFNSVLPLALNKVSVHRVMTTETASAIQPFSTQEMQVKDGFYYGLNQLSKNIVVYNRSLANNQNGVILGSPGGGKSFAAKMEMYQAYLNTVNSQIFIVDPEREYTPLAKELDGVIFKIEPGGDVHINPLDLDITKSAEDTADPFAQKVDFVISIVESMLGGRGQLNGYLRSIVDNTLQRLYAPYLEHLRTHNLTIDTKKCPTLEDFYNELRGRKEAEAKNLASSIQMYCVGSLNLFSHHTNVNTNNRMIIYDTKNIGVNLQELGMQICLNDIWNRMIANKKLGIRTWFYIDEFYLLLRQPSSAAYLQMVWKRARKWMGTPTGITQNVSDLLNSPEGQTILDTSDFALLLTQSFNDRMMLAQIFHLSDDQMEYINTGTPGNGLIVTPRAIVPFENVLPNDSPIYKLLSTKAADAENL